MGKLTKENIIKAFNEPHPLWTALFIIQIFLLVFLFVYKFVIPKSVCFCDCKMNKLDEIFDEQCKTQYMIKFRDYGDCESVCINYNRTWSGEEMEWKEFREWYQEKLNLGSIRTFNLTYYNFTIQRGIEILEVE